METFHLATRPYDIIAAVNRYAAATGSQGYAERSHGASYNGHFVRVYFNSYVGYWLAEYTWSGRQVLSRGSLVEALRAAKSEYDRGALGACVVASYHARGVIDRHEPSESLEDFEAACKAAGYAEGDEPKTPAWRTPLHNEVSGAFEYERHGLAPAVGLLCNSKTLEEYKAKLDAFFNERKRSGSRFLT